MDMSDDSKKNFFKYVFNFDDESKGDLLNLVQYSLLSLIPIVSLNKAMAKYVPEADDKKGSLEISAEIVIQILVMFFGLFLINRIVTFVPTYSEKEYPETYSVHFIVLAVLMITLSLQTKLGEKVNILVERLYELWNGKEEKTKTINVNGKQVTVKVTQPISGQQQQQSQSSYSDGTSITSLPPPDMSAAAVTNSALAPQQMPDFNNMFRQDTTPLINAAMPGQMEGFGEPMAANGVLGGGSFGSW
jgi:hypothetical protein